MSGLAIVIAASLAASEAHRAEQPRKGDRLQRFGQREAAH